MATKAATEYIDADLDDYAIAYDLAHQVFATGGHDLPKPAATSCPRWRTSSPQRAREAKGPPEALVQPPDIREATNLPDHIVKRHMREIEDLEYVPVQRAPRAVRSATSWPPPSIVPATSTASSRPKRSGKSGTSGTKVERGRCSSFELAYEELNSKWDSGTGKHEGL